MKRVKIIVLILFWLSSQQAFAGMSATMLAQGTMPAADKHAMQTDCHSAVSTDSLGEHLEPASSCCQTYCQCSAISGFAMPMNTPSPSLVSDRLSLQFPYLTVIPQAPRTSLYRPPITV
jgi:hypothetical protein